MASRAMIGLPAMPFSYSPSPQKRSKRNILSKFALCRIFRNTERYLPYKLTLASECASRFVLGFRFFILETATKGTKDVSKKIISNLSFYALVLSLIPNLTYNFSNPIWRESHVYRRTLPESLPLPRTQ